jgi:putative peptidoglycan lipid II flippase
MSRRLAAGDEAGAAEAQGRAIDLTLVLSVPCIAIAIAIPELVMRALFMRGAFTAGDATAAAATLAAYATGLLPFVLIRSFVAPFYARGDTWTPMKAALIAVLVNILLKIALMANLAQVGLALATAAGAWVNLALLWLAAKRLGFQRPVTTLEGAMRLLFAGLVTGIALHFGERLIGPLLSVLPRLREETLLLVVLILGAVVYVALVTLFRGRTWLKGLLRDAGSKASV